MALLPIVGHFPPARQLLRAEAGTLDRAYLLARDVEGVSDLLRIMEENGAEPVVSQAEGVEEALRQLGAALAMGGQAGEAVSAGLLELYRSLFAVDLETRNQAARGLADIIAGAAVAFLGEMGRLAGSIVETGGDPTIALDDVMSRMPEVLDMAGAFVEACRRQGGPEEKMTELVQRYGQGMAQRMPAEASALQSTSSLCLGAIAMLSRSRAMRKRYGGDESLIERARKVGAVIGSADFLRKMLQVLDDETLVVIEPGMECGWRMRIQGIADNFQLHTLLAGAIVGPAKEGWIPGVVGVAREGEAEAPVPGRPLDRRAVDIARYLPCTMRDLTVWSHLQLWTWKALQADGTLPDETSGDLVRNEGVPADIPGFEGERVILVGSGPVMRSWNGGRVFSGMVGSLVVEGKMEQEEVRSLLHRIAVAPRAG
jgi:hypothetical protein